MYKPGKVNLKLGFHRFHSNCVTHVTILSIVEGEAVADNQPEKHSREDQFSLPYGSLRLHYLVMTLSINT